MERNLTQPAEAGSQERGVHAASSFKKQQANSLVQAIQTLKRPEGRAPGAVPKCARTDSCHKFRSQLALEQFLHTWKVN
jgi:hypothetical protein